MMKRVDKDGSGTIEFEEFLALMAEKIVRFHILTLRLRETPIRSCRMPSGFSMLRKQARSR